MKNYIKPSLILVVLIVLGTFVYVGAQSNQNNFNQGTGSGSGTVSPNNGSAGAVANYAAGAGSITVGPDTLLTDSGTLLTYTGSGGISGKSLNMPGATSGTSTITPPAVAGTATNPIALSNAITVPNGGTGTASIQCNTGCTGNSGFYWAAANAPAIQTANGILVFDGTSSPATLRSTVASALGTTAAPYGTLFNNGGINDGANVLFSGTAPTISSGFGTSPSVVNNNGTLAFTINVGGGGAASTGVIGLPTAAHGWACTCADITTNSATVFACKQTGAGTTTTAPIGEFTAAGAAQAWTASDVLNVSCTAF